MAAVGRRVFAITLPADRKREDLSAAAQQKEKKQSASRPARALYETILYL